MEMVAEGIETARSLHYLSQEKNIEMPICEQIYKVLFEDIHPRQAILKLMGRALVDEHPV
jgi:glycerol-3-phosphate dehydrogenase (NAD(P)+)